ncbi:MAG TPA: hypothetical protein VGK17_02630 [Propionicimonas sp.]
MRIGRLRAEAGRSRGFADVGVREACRDFGVRRLPWPAGRRSVTYVWFPEHRLALEFDREAVHTGHEQFEEDQRRQNRMTVAQIKVLRFTWEAVERHAEVVVATVRAMLRARMS